MADIDVLQIKATGEVSSAEKSLNSLISTLERVQNACTAVKTSLSGINNTGGLAKLNTALSTVSNSFNTTGAAATENNTKFNTLNQSVQNLLVMLNKLVQVNVNVSNITNSVTNATSTSVTQINNCTSAINRNTQSASNGAAANRVWSRSISSTIGQLAILYMGVKKIANVLSDCFNESNDYIEKLNLFNVTMRDTADSAYEYAESVQKIMGIDIAEWMDYQGTFQQLAKGFGVVSEQADIMSQNLTQLSYDLASFFNTDTETAFEKLSSAMTGQVKGLREFGIDTTVASLQEYALAKGIKVAVSEMTQAQKSVLRYNYILEKSIDIQGDMARTIATPANARRIVNAQMEQCKRAFGNIISVFVTKFIPYIQAAVMLLTDAANAIADFLGFELPTIDYSDLDDAVSVTEDMSDSIDSTAESAKELKKQLMGFDELNILQSPDIDTDTSSTNNLPSDLGLGVPEYDFGLDKVSSQAEKIYEKLKDFFKKIVDLWENFEGTIKRVAEILAGIWAISEIKKFVNWIKNSTSVLAKLLRQTKLFKALNTLFPNILSGFAEGWKLASANGEGFFGKLKSGITGARNNLSTLQKGIITVATTLVAGFSGYNLFHDLTNGTLTWYNALMDITFAAGAIGLAFALTGPVGGVITVLGFVVGAIFGVESAVQEAMDTAVNEAFYDGLGVSITDLSDDFCTLMDDIKETYDTYNQTFDEMAENKTSLEETSNNIGLISSAMENGVTDVQTGCDNILAAITQLETDTKTQCDLIYESIYTACSGSFGDALEDAGISTDALLKLTALTASNMNQDAADILQQMTDITNSYKDGKITQDEYTDKLSSLQGKYNDIMGVTDDATQATKDFATSLDNLNDIDWENESARNEAFENIKESASGAKDSINEYYDNLSQNIEELRDKYDEGTEEWSLYDKALGITDTARKEALENVNTQVNDFLDSVQKNLVTELGDMQDDIDEAWDNLSFWERVFYWGDDKDKYTKNFLENYNENIVQPISDDIQTCMDEIGTNGEVYADEAVDNILSRLTIWKDGVWQFDYGEFDNAMSKELNKMGVDGGENMIKGLNNGVKSKLPETNDLIRSFPSDLHNTFKVADDQHSPSHIWEGFGVNSIQGYINGFTSMFKKAVTAVNTFFNEIHNTWESKTDALSSEIDKLFSVSAWTNRAVRVSNALANNLRIPALPNIGLNLTFDGNMSDAQRKAMQALGLSGYPKFQWYTYAQGGFPSMGEMFIAREKGPEMVGKINNKTSVANNDQIVEGISNGVYNAVSAAMSRNGGNGHITVNTTFEVDGEVIGRKSVEYHNSEVIRTGVSPLLI